MSDGPGRALLQPVMVPAKALEITGFRDSTASPGLDVVDIATMCSSVAARKAAPDISMADVFPQRLERYISK
jgi:hypothetical protein